MISFSFFFTHSLKQIQRFSQRKQIWLSKSMGCMQLSRMSSCPARSKLQLSQITGKFQFTETRRAPILMQKILWLNSLWTDIQLTSRIPTHSRQLSNTLFFSLFHYPFKPCVDDKRSFFKVAVWLHFKKWYSVLRGKKKKTEIVFVKFFLNRLTVSIKL